MVPDEELSNYQLFRDCLSTPLIEKSVGDEPKKRKARKYGRKTAIKPVSTQVAGEVNDADELAEFIDYIATEVFSVLPSELRRLSYSTWLNTTQLQNDYSLPLDLDATDDILNVLSPSIIDSFQTYSLLPPNRTPVEFFTPILNTYLTVLTTAPPPPSMTKNQASECEICERSWIPLTYHHLIPREMHTKVLKRGWHTQDMLENVAWICRACHSFVHRVASNEELAKDLYTVDLLRDREDVQKFALWVGKVRWKAR
ncbi:hypothetical protein BP5796_06188 [Coleophoma crateriformis]|uniref:HNH domain-containing protein n=1 Tax=Coleophoma crateriformis TaxID=565419 RepID=A0A3D8RWH9_9HELO|nr:hypothetical protein BP5796_06188 [Coleophoma crateriformis]